LKKAIARISKNDQNDDRLKVWIFIAARNIVLCKVWKNTNKGDAFPEKVTTEASTRVDEGATQDRPKLHEHLTGLSQMEQDIMALKFSSQLDNRRLGQILGLPESKVDRQMRQILDKLS
jgi:DNA-directed RNA polymerase specialized sigma subunit